MCPVRTEKMKEDSADVEQNVNVNTLLVNESKVIGRVISHEYYDIVRSMRRYTRENQNQATTNLKYMDRSVLEVATKNINLVLRLF